ncbi:extracellular solute-binding protein [Sporanaerobacter acetigenes]|uniref:Iron(III) transport system substrate-binding protein n=1 Tax=Sporanaerobacter acetigenes DSM 13106 TaxID=1123281 RepID=A0A1M5YAF4_9FIRM|nr:extracellular solute-binding protein [Sporanaerobacter acetigenes]SHI08946.1 iron(III) transport system substrate-binding protein [Sporanaerobacter acetigenes DSM 13106]
MKKFLSLIIAVILTLSLVACGNDTTKNEQTPPSSEEQGSESQQDAVELEDKLVIYSTHPEDMLEFLAEEFEKETGVTVEFINLRGELADRVRAEKENPQSDIMYGGASSLFIDLNKEGLFEKYIPTWDKDIDPMYKDSEGYWYGTIQTPVMIFYNNEMLSEEEAPKDWYDLSKPEFKDNIVTRNTLSSSIRATYASLLYQFDKEGKIDDGWEFMKEMESNIKNYYGSGSLQFQAVGRKEAAISYAVLSSIIDNIEENDMPLTIVDAESGSPVITDAIAVIKGAKHPKAAEAFVEFAGSPEIQAKLANDFNRLPTHPEAIKNGKQWMKESNYKVMDVDWSVVSEKEAEWLQKWDTDIKDGNKEVNE